MKDSGKKQKKGKGLGPNPILVLMVVAFVALALWVTVKRDGTEEIRQEGVKPDHDIGISISHLSRLGKTVAIGATALAVKADGTDIVGGEGIPGLGDLLEGRDVDAVSAALENAGVRHVLVDPSIVKRNPIPRNTVKNRLALARPSGRLTATRMSKQLFVYELGDPPLDLPVKAKEVLTTIARSAFGGGNGEVPEGAPEIVNQKGDWKILLTVRPLQSQHLSYHSVSADKLADAARKAGLKARRYYLKRESFSDRHGLLEQQGLSGTLPELTVRGWPAVQL